MFAAMIRLRLAFFLFLLSTIAALALSSPQELIDPSITLKYFASPPSAPGDANDHRRRRRSDAPVGQSRQHLPRQIHNRRLYIRYPREECPVDPLIVVVSLSRTIAFCPQGINNPEGI
jgi:hypothetical protein